MKNLTHFPDDDPRTRTLATRMADPDRNARLNAIPDTDFDTLPLKALADKHDLPDLDPIETASVIGRRLDAKVKRAREEDARAASIAAKARQPNPLQVAQDFDRAQSAPTGGLPNPGATLRQGTVTTDSISGKAPEAGRAPATPPQPGVPGRSPVGLKLDLGGGRQAANSLAKPAPTPSRQPSFGQSATAAPGFGERFLSSLEAISGKPRRQRIEDGMRVIDNWQAALRQRAQATGVELHGKEDPVNEVVAMIGENRTRPPGSQGALHGSQAIQARLAKMNDLEIARLGLRLMPDIAGRLEASSVTLRSAGPKATGTIKPTPHRFEFVENILLGQFTLKPLGEFVAGAKAIVGLPAVNPFSGRLLTGRDRKDAMFRAAMDVMLLGVSALGGSAVKSSRQLKDRTGFSESELLGSSRRQYRRSSDTVATRSVRKHIDREAKSAHMVDLLGRGEDVNKQVLEHIEQIVYDPKRSIVWKGPDIREKTMPVWEIRARDGRGFRIDTDGNFYGVIEPPTRKNGGKP